MSWFNRHREDHRAGIADTEAWEIAPDWYRDHSAAEYHTQLDDVLRSEGWSDFDRARTHLDIAEGVSNQAVAGQGNFSDGW